MRQHLRGRRRTFAALAMVCALATGTTAGCATGGGSTGAHGSLTLYNDNPAWASGFLKAGTALKEITGHDLKSVALPSTADYQQVLNASLTTKKPGDIVKVGSGTQLQPYAASGELTDLTAIWDSDVKKGWLNDSLRPYYSRQGKVYALPLVQSYWVVFYNKHLFSQYGIQVPTTYAQFTAAAATLKKHNVTPIWTDEFDQWTSMIPYMLLAGAVSPDFYTKLSNNQASLAGPESKQVLQLWQTWIKSGWTTEPDTKLADAPSLMKSGKLAMFPIGTWEGASLKATGMTPGVDYGAFLMPSLPGVQQAVFTEGGAIAVPKNAPDHAAAMKQMAAWLDPRVQKVWSGFLGDSSPNPKVPVTDPVISAVASQVQANHTLLLNRYFEALPPSLVQDSTTTLDGFMVHPNSLSSVLSALAAAEVKDWATWKKQH